MQLSRSTAAMTAWAVVAMAAVIAAVAATAPSFAALPAYNPINGTIPASPLSAELVDVIRIPDSSGSAPRLEYLAEAPDATGRLYVSDQRGRVWRFQPGDQQPEVFLDTSTLPGFNTDNQTGLRGFAFHPDYAKPGTAGQGKFYVSYVTNPQGAPDFPVPPGANTVLHAVVAEYTLGPSGVIDPGSQRELMRIGEPFGDHNIGNIAFNPTVAPASPDYGKLYIALGDGGNNFPAVPIDPFNNGQNRSSPLGTLLRIDPIQSGADAYTVPADNPLVGTPGALPEVWASGLRNPHNFTWDLGGDHKMLIADIGQDNIEEVNLGAPGANYGWDNREGTFQVTNPNAAPNRVDTLPVNHATDPFTYPVAQYDHDWDNNNSRDGLFAIAGGQVYRDAALPALQGQYIFGDFASGQVSPILLADVDDLTQRDDFTNVGTINDGFIAPLTQLQITRNGSPTTLRDLIRQASGDSGQNRTDMRFGVDAAGGVYILNKHDGWVRKLLPGPRAITDFNFSGFSDSDDLEALFAAFGFITSNTTFLNLVTTGPSAVFIDDADVDAWLAAAGSFRGDADVDGFVAQADLDAVLLNWGATDARWATGDFNGDGFVAQSDLDAVLLNWGATAEPSFAANPAVPEPGVGVLLLGMAGLLKRSARRAWVCV